MFIQEYLEGLLGQLIFLKKILSAISCAISSAVERLLHTQEVTGSNPVSRTTYWLLFSLECSS